MPSRKPRTPPRAETYRHSDEAVLRPDVGTQATFRKRREPTTYRYESSLSPALDWDGQNSARELGEWLLAQIEEASKLAPPHTFSAPRYLHGVEISGLDDAVAHLVALSQPFLNWSGKAERQSFDVPTLPLFVHERLSTKAILETLKGHERDRQIEFQLFGDPQLSLAQQLEAYEHRGGWVNRLILGDSLVVMNSLLEFEGLGGSVQMIYMDPPYGVKFGSNFQPFVRRRDVKDGSDDDLTREPEMVQAYRDTWELGVHSYLTYLRDRLLLARDLLAQSGSVFVQISDENVHLLRSVLDEVFGVENFAGQIAFTKTSSQSTTRIQSVFDVLLVYAKDVTSMKFRPLLQLKKPGERGAMQYTLIFSPDLSEWRRMTDGELSGGVALPDGWRIGRLGPVLSQGWQSGPRGEPYMWDEEPIAIPPNSHWKYDPSPGGAMDNLRSMGRLKRSGKSLATILLADDNPTTPLDNLWVDTGTGSFTEDQIFVVQTAEKVVQRCMLMVTDPGDLVFDPTCGSGTTAYVAENWGRRWITVDTSRVPIALARQRLLTGTFSYFELLDQRMGPGGGFVYSRRQNRKGEEVGGIVPHISLGDRSKGELTDEVVLLDRPNINAQVTRVTGPFCVEATIPPASDTDADHEEPVEQGDAFPERMLEVLRRNPVLQLGGNQSITLTNIRAPGKSLTLSAEASMDDGHTAVALVFGPENAAISERLVYESAREAHARNYGEIILIGFAIEAGARQLTDRCIDLVGIPAAYVQATPDLVMGDLLKSMRSSQIFSVTGQPDIAVRTVQAEERDDVQYEVELRGLDVFDPTTMESDHRQGLDVPAWFLDTDYNDLCFHVSQAFFPRTAAWDSLKRALKGTYDDSIWEHLAGTTSASFRAGDHRQIAVKVIDDRGNELMVVKSLDEAK